VIGFEFEFCGMGLVSNNLGFAVWIVNLKICDLSLFIRYCKNYVFSKIYNTAVYSLRIQLLSIY